MIHAIITMLVAIYEERMISWNIVTSGAMSFWSGWSSSLSSSSSLSKFPPLRASLSFCSSKSGSETNSSFSSSFMVVGFGIWNEFLFSGRSWNGNFKNLNYKSDPIPFVFWTFIAMNRKEFLVHKFLLANRSF